MAFDRFLIAPIITGLQTDLRPWLIPDDAFTSLNNVYIFRGRVRKRFGGTLTGNGAPNSVIAPFYSRLSMQIGTTNGSGNFSGVVPLPSVGAIGQAFTIANEIFTVYEVGSPADMLDTGSSTMATYDTTSGAVDITGSTPLTAVYYYPGLPVMGLTTYDQAGVSVNDQPAYAFDTHFAYTFSSANGFWLRSGTLEWHGGNGNFFWTCNWRGVLPNIRALFVSNYYVVNPNGLGAATDDFIKWTIDGTNWIDGGLVANRFYFAPTIAGVPQPPQTGPYVVTARIIAAFKNRLVLLNTIENDGSGAGGFGNNTQYVNRARWSSYGSPFAQNAWYELNQSDNMADPNKSFWSGAAYLDAPTDEAIISAEFIKDRLIVFFERSTWELVYVQNQSQTFAWQKINTELGSEATFSTVPFDRHILTMSNTGVHACNGANVERIDTKIPDEVFTIRNKNQGVTRVVGIRDFYTELVYWTFPSDNQRMFCTDVSCVDPTFPNKVLVYNYRTGSWALFDDSITCFGYFNQQIDATWASLNDTTWAQANFSWDSATEQVQNRQVIAGNQQGYVFIVDSDNARNARVLQINNILNNVLGYLEISITNHNLMVGDFIAIESALNSPITVGIANATILQVLNVDGVDDITAWCLLNPDNYTQFNGTYIGGGVATLVSNINFQSKQLNPYVSQGRDVYVGKVDFCVIKTSQGEITVDYLTSSSNLSMIDEGTATGTIMGTNVLQTAPYADPYYAFEQTQVRIWHPIYFQSQGEFIQLDIYFSPTENSTAAIAWSDFQIEGMVLHTSPTSSRLQ
jgi:hypothetical protein